MNRSPTCMRRALVPSGKPWACVPLPRLAVGFKIKPAAEKACWLTAVLYWVLNALKASARNWSLVFSDVGNSLKSEKSRLREPGPRRCSTLAAVHSTSQSSS